MSIYSSFPQSFFFFFRGRALDAAQTPFQCERSFINSRQCRNNPFQLPIPPGFCLKILYSVFSIQQQKIPHSLLYFILKKRTTRCCGSRRSERGECQRVAPPAPLPPPQFTVFLVCAEDTMKLQLTCPFFFQHVSEFSVTCSCEIKEK